MSTHLRTACYWLAVTAVALAAATAAGARFRGDIAFVIWLTTAALVGLAGLICEPRKDRQ
jgi:hypothetical protein